MLAELLHLWEVVNVMDENLAPAEGGLRRPGVVDGKVAPRAYGPGELLLVELPGIELGTDISLTCGNNEIGDAKARETTWRDLRAYRSVVMTSTLRLARRVLANHVGHDFEMGRQAADDDVGTRAPGQIRLAIQGTNNSSKGSTV